MSQNHGLNDSSCCMKSWTCCPKIHSGAGTPTSEIPQRSAVSSEVVHIEMNTIVDRMEREAARGRL